MSSFNSNMLKSKLTQKQKPLYIHIEFIILKNCYDSQKYNIFGISFRVISNDH